MTEEDLIREFRSALENTANIAVRIDMPGWAPIFRRAARILTDDFLPPRQRLQAAYEGSNVFGGMGSWNDSPPCMAHEKGLTAEFDAANAALYEARKRTLLYLRRTPTNGAPSD